MDTREILNKEGQDFVAPKIEGGEQTEQTQESKNEAVFNKIKVLMDKKFAIQKADELAGIIRGGFDEPAGRNSVAYEANATVSDERGLEIDEIDTQINVLRGEISGNREDIKDLEQKISDYHIERKKQLDDDIAKIEEELKNVK